MVDQNGGDDDSHRITQQTDWRITVFTNKTNRLIAALGLFFASLWPVLNYTFPEVPWHEKAIQLGDVVKGILSSNCEQMRRYKIAAAQGDALAMDAVASFYQLGYCVPQSDDKAVLWYKKASARQDSWAMVEMGTYYLNGTRGLIIDYKKAMEYFRLAMNHESRAYTLIGTMYENGLVDDGRKDVRQADKFYELGLINGDSRAAALIGSLYRNGSEPIHKDCVKAMSYYKKGVELGDDRSNTLIGDLYDTGCTPYVQSPDEAMNWYKKGAEAGDPRAGTLILSHGGSWPNRNLALQRSITESAVFFVILIAVSSGGFILLSAIRRWRASEIHHPGVKP